MHLPQLSPVYLALIAVAAVLNIIIPVVLAVVLVRRLKVRPWVVFAGAAVFIVFQGILRIPWVLWLEAHFAEQLKGDVGFRLGFFAFLALTAALFEEVGRYIGYRVFFRKEALTWRSALVFGAGHGGVEAIGLAGLGGLSSFATLLLLPGLLPTLPESAQRTAVEQFQALAAQPDWFPLLATYERIGAIIFHLAMSVVVYQVIRRRQLGWLFLAIALHALLDFASVAVTLIPGIGTVSAALVAEGLVTLFAVLGLALIFRLRDPASVAATPAVTQASV